MALEVPYLLFLGDFWARVFWSGRQGGLGHFWLTRQGIAPAAQAQIPAQNSAQILEMGEKSAPAVPPKL